MKNFLKVAKVSLMVMACALFLGIGIKAEAAPGKVTGLKQTDANSGSVTIRWDEAEGDVAAYLVEWCQSSTFTGTTYGYATTTSIGGKIPNLASGKTYYVRVTAADSEAPGETSDVIDVVTSPYGKVAGFKQGKEEATKIALSWRKVTGANGYYIGYYKKSTKGKLNEVVTGDVSSYKLSAAANTKYCVDILPVRKSRAGFVAYGANSLGWKDMSTKPTKIKSLKFIGSGSSTDPYAKIAYFSWSRSDAAAGYEYTLYGNNGKQVAKKTITIDKPNKGVKISNKKLVNTQFMKIRVRAYILVNGVKKYGPSSDYCWFGKYPPSVKKAMAGRYASDGVKISWKKMTGAKNYTVLVSTKPNSGYKKVTTTSKTSCVIKKCGKSTITTGKYYYYKVVANKKVGKKTIKSDDDWHGEFFITTRYY